MRTEEPMNEFLSKIADQEVPSPDPAFVEHLDARLRIAHAESAPAAGPRARLVPALAVFALLVIGLVGTISVRNQDRAAVVMTVASDTSVYLDGGPVAGRAGLVLPDGARIVVGPTGEAVVDGVVLAAGAEAIVVDDRVTLVISGDDQQPTEPDRSTISVETVDERANPRPAPTTAPSPTRSATGDASRAGRPAGSSASSAPTSSVTDRSLPDEDGRPTSTGTAGTVAPDQTRPASTRPESTSTTTVSSTGSSGTVPTSVSPGRITLTATDVGADRVRLDWVIDRDLATMGWRIWTGRGDREATILVIRGGSARSATLERAVIVGRSVWVEAVDRSGGTVAASEPVSIG